MRTYIVRDLMVPLAEYATVSEDATLYEAIMALEKAQQEFDQTRYRHRAVLVYDKNHKIVGKLSQVDALKALEPKYKELQTEGIIRHLGFSTKFIQGMMDQFSLWATPLVDICRKAGTKKVKECISKPSEGELIDEDASLDVAIHQLIMGYHQSLLARDKAGEIVGILRLSDVFAAVFHKVKECSMEALKGD